MKSICLLGGSGSIGASTLDVIARNREDYRLRSVSIHSNLQRLVEIVEAFEPEYAVVSDLNVYEQARQLPLFNEKSCTLLRGQEGLCEIASDSEVEIVVAAIVGAAGLAPSLAAANAGKVILLANKESLVMSGQLFIDTARRCKATILPIDSEHNAIFQSLPHDFSYGDLVKSGVQKLLLTGSGGPFLKAPLESLEGVTPAQACKHPNWSMGQKISVDSATMMNKGLEFIETCWIFGVKPESIEVVIHPQSVIHSMVQYVDGSVIAQMGNPDMRTPIAHALSYPNRIVSGVEPLDFSRLTEFEFHKPDFQRFPNLKLAIDAMQLGQYATTALNAANEIAVDAFLSNKLAFTDIAKLNESVLNDISHSSCDNLSEILQVDGTARRHAHQYLEAL